MALTSQQIAQGMIDQLRTLDPSFNSELGTPERKIIDSVAEALAESQVDLSLIDGGFDIDTKFGDNLDRFLALFGFARQKSTFATGFLTFSRDNPAATDIIVPVGTRVTLAEQTGPVAQQFMTVISGTISANSQVTSVSVPCRAVISGSAGNVAANTITVFVNAPTYGVTSVTNQSALTGGLDQEDDDELKIRFKATGPFRNLAGTVDQYSALAVATNFSKKANIVGPISRYVEFMQVPQADDATSYDINGDGLVESGNSGSTNVYTTALSTVPNSKHIWTTQPFTIWNGQTDDTATFYRDGVDFKVNTAPAQKNFGDAYRLAHPSTDDVDFDDKPLDIDPVSEAARFKPSISFTNVYTGVDATVQAIRANDVIAFEHSYMSEQSRNDPDRNIANAVDVFVDGGNILQATAILPAPGSDALFESFVNDPSSKFYFLNYQRYGQPNRPPCLANFLAPLFWQPVTALPDSITVTGTIGGSTGVVNTYFQNVHYWLVEDVSELRGSTRARNGLEWSKDNIGQLNGDPPGGPYTGNHLTEYESAGANAASYSVTDYSYDANIVTMQNSLDAAKQVTTDVLGHKSHARYFKPDITVMYGTNTSSSIVNTAIQTALSDFFDGQFFGQVIQLSDLLDVIHSAPGVDNVRWSSETLGNSTLYSLNECDVNGLPLASPTVDTTILGSGTSQQRLILGDATGGTFALYWLHGTAGWQSTGPIPWNVSAADLYNIYLPQAGLTQSAPVDGSGTAASPFNLYLNTAQPLQVYNPSLADPFAGFLLTGSKSQISGDFFLDDDELPALPVGIANVVNSIIRIRTRVQSTWARS